MLNGRSRSVHVVVLVALAVCAGSVAPLSAFRARNLKGILFAAAYQPAMSLRAAGAEVLRSRYVTVDVAALLATRSNDTNEATRPTLLLNLFDDLAYNAVVDRFDVTQSGFTWVGHVQGVDASSITLAQVDGVIAGTVTVPDATYTVRFLGEGIHEVAEVDPSKLLQELEPVPAEPAGLSTLRGQDLPQKPAVSTPVATPAAGLVTVRKATTKPVVKLARLTTAATEAGVGTGGAIAGVEPMTATPVARTAPPGGLASREGIDFIEAPPSGGALGPPQRPAVTSVSHEPVAVRVGGGAWMWSWPELDGTRIIQLDSDSGLELTLPRSGLARYVGSELVADEPWPLPPGAMLDGVAGTFNWRPPAGYRGLIDLEFVSDDGAVVRVRLDVASLTTPPHGRWSVGP